MFKMCKGCDYMPKFRNYKPEPLFGEDYYALRSFLIKLDNINYPFGRWDWMITHGNLDKTGLPRIGLWEDGGEIVGAATYDLRFGNAFILVDKKFEFLCGEMISYAKGAFNKGDEFAVMIRDGDIELQEAASKLGFFPSQDKDCDAVFIIDADKINYELPDGFSITSMADNYDLYKYGECLWKGFNHEANGEGTFVFKESELPLWEIGFKRPNVNLDLKIAVVSPEGKFVSYCGMWLDDASPDALVEPVATDPAYRKMGLGRAAVLEAVKRCGKLGAKRAFVGSDQQFYYQIGFRPFMTSTWWKQK